MIKSYKDFLSRAALCIYAVLFTFVLGAVIFNNVCFDYDRTTTLKFMAAEAAILFAALALYTGLRKYIIRYRYFILAAVLLGIFAVQFWIGNHMIANPLNDHGEIFWGAVEYAANGKSAAFDNYSNYLHHYPQQMGLFLSFQRIFKIAGLLGISSYSATALVGHLLFMVMIAATFIYLEDVVNSDAALFSLLMAVMFIPIYFQSSISYTDTYSVWGIPVFLMLATKALKTRSVNKKIICSLLAGLLLGVCMQIKVTVLFSVIALLIQVVVTGFNKKEHVAIILAIALGRFCADITFEKWSYNTVLEPDRAIEGMPTTHWIMMGLQGDGDYNADDEWRVTGSVDFDQRVALNIEVIKQRLSDMGVGGYLQLLYRKTCRSFGSGGAEMYYTYLYERGNMELNNIIYNLVFQHGQYYYWYDYISHSMYLMMTLLGVVAVLLIMVKKDRLLYNFAPFIAQIGFWMFMMLWESNHRQLINQWSLYLMAGATGLYMIWKTAMDIARKRKVNK